MIDDIRALKFSADEPQVMYFDGNGIEQLGSHCEWKGHLEYSYDGREWRELDPRHTCVPFGDYGHPHVYLRGENENLHYAMKDEYGGRVNLTFRFQSAASVRCEGNVMNLLDKDLDLNHVPDRCFTSLFSGCGQLVQAPELPAAHMGENCYEGMFMGCSLTKAPELPSTDLSAGCYRNMFVANNKLAEGPELPATRMKQGCYERMFGYCEGLKKAPALPAGELASDCYSGMFEGCGRLKETPGLKAEHLAAGCYERMFVGCKGLKEVPSLPAEHAKFNSYADMFAGCTGLEKVSSLGLKDMDGLRNACDGMFKDCYSLESVRGVEAEKASMDLMKEQHPGLFNSGLRRRLNSYVHYRMLRDMGVSPEQSCDMTCRKFRYNHAELADNFRLASRNGFDAGDDASFASDYARNRNLRDGVDLSRRSVGNRI